MSELHERMSQLVNQMDQDLKQFPYAGDNSSEEGFLLWSARNILATLTTEAKLESIIDSAAIACLKNVRDHVGPNLNYTTAAETLTTIIDGLEERKKR